MDKRSMQEIMIEKLMRRCKFFGTCDCPKCPLDLEMDHKTMYGDEKVCPIKKWKATTTFRNLDKEDAVTIHKNIETVTKIKRWQKDTKKNKEKLFICTNKGKVKFMKENNQYGD